jgi:tRNA pseudouridine13 synthase
MYVLKQVPEDFIVDEVLTPILDGGMQHMYLLRKRDHTTSYAIFLLAKENGLPTKAIGYAGNKDRRAITTQIISCNRKINITHPEISLEYLGSGKERINLGNNEGNKFTIIIRKVNKVPTKIDSFLNVFGPQRFSTNNVEIGRALVTKNYAKAVQLLKDNSPVNVTPKESPIDTLKQYPVKDLSFLAHAFQSFLWNTLVQRIPADKIPANLELPGFGSEYSEEIQPFVDQILDEEKITSRDFINKSIRQLSLEGGKRKVSIQVKDLAIGGLLPDELNEGFSKVTISFTLPSGAYATVFIGQLLQEHQE